MRDFNVEFERLVLRLKEVQCEIPPLIKGWLYLDKLKLNEHAMMVIPWQVRKTNLSPKRLPRKRMKHS